MARYKSLLTVRVIETNRLAAGVRDQILRCLSHRGSDFWKKLLNQQQCGPIAVVTTHGAVLSWVRSDHWDGKQTLECYTLPAVRRKGYALLAARALVAGTFADLDEPVAVFSDEAVGLARRVGFTNVEQFYSEGDKWLPASPTPPA
jgi:hypothetical protein